ncbi:MAG TPA: hypothetical protein VFP42_00035 [Acidimicrobiia bacterium]|nr:hypothetical protein [Acidimicrobiia bacterium]
MRSIDPILSLVGPIGLAASLGTALVIDLGPSGANEGRSLRDISADGPTLAELSPGRRGVAMIPGGGIDPRDAIDLIEQLAIRWPAVAVRVEGPGWPFPVVPVIPIYPGRLLVSTEPLGVWQPIGGSGRAPGPGPVLPRLRAGQLRRLLSGQVPRRSRWVDAWRPVWDMPWA